jgi:hypothetical protein
MKSSETTQKIAAALVKVHKEIETIPFDAKNPFFKSKYTSLTAIMETIRPMLAKHGLFVLQGAGFHHTDSEGAITAITVDTSLIHESGEFYTIGVVVPLARGKDGVTPQAAGAAITYAKRYGVSAVLALVTDEDDDGNMASGRSHGEASARRPVRKAVHR